MVVTLKKRNAQRRMDAIRSRHPRHIEREYRRALERRVRTIGRFTHDAVDKYLVTKRDEINELARQDTQEEIVRGISRVISGVRLTVEGQWTEKEDEDLAHDIGEQVDLFETNQTARQWDAVMGVDPVFSDRAVQQIIGDFTAQNLQLIRDIGPEITEQVEEHLITAVREGQRAEDFSEIVQERLGVAESRAQLIARDQIGSMTGRITQARQEDLGVTRYQWSTSQDERVVGNPSGLYPEPTDETMHGDHWEREGEIYEWTHRHSDGHPGRAIQCRCTADPQIEDLL